MTSIGIIGAGIAGLHLGLFLRAHGIDATIYTEKTPEQQLGGRLANIVIRSAPTRERERLLGVNHWDSIAPDIAAFSVHIGGARPLSFTGDFDQPASIVDMRIYSARLLEDFARRGGRVVFGALQSGDVARLGADHDLMVVAAGRSSLHSMFPRLPEHSPYDRPQRLVVGGLYHGLDYPEPHGFDVFVSPRQGEILALPLHSFEPGLTGVSFEIVPGGGFEALWRLRYENDPRRFEMEVLGMLRDHAPDLYARADPARFALARPLDLFHVAITPTVRRGYSRLPGGKYAVALGDVHVVNDPITGQGANTASRAAWVLGEAIRDGDGFDEAFCQHVEQRMWSYSRAITEACNARLRPAAPHMIELMIAAAQNQAVADAYVQGFNHPDRFWDIISSPTRTAVFLRQLGWQGMPPVARAA